MRRDTLLLALASMFPQLGISQSSADSVAVVSALDSWNRGWAQGVASAAVADYADDADWTNAFGDRVIGRDSLKSTLEFIFGLDFVMAGSSGQNEYEDVLFLSPEIALVRSKLVRVGQEMRSGEAMPDRQIHHLRVLQKRNGRWQIVSHLISQAQPKR